MAAGVVIAVAAAVAYAYTPAPPATPSDPLEPGVQRSTLLRGTTPTGASWVLSGGRDTTGALCGDLQISTSAAFFGACGLQIDPTVVEVVKPDCVTCAPRASVSSSSHSLLPASGKLIKTVVAIDPENGLSFVFGTASTHVARIVVQIPYMPSETYDVVNTSVGPWFGGPVAGLEIGTRAVFSAIDQYGAVIDAMVREATGPQLDSCRNTNPDTINRYPLPGVHCVPPLTLNAPVAGTELPVNRDLATIDVPVASLTPATTIEADLGDSAGHRLANGAGRLEEPGAAWLRLPLTASTLAALADRGRLPSQLTVSFSQDGETVERQQPIDLVLRSHTGGP